MGDLNYRVLGDHESILEAVRQNRFELLRQTDQLRMEMKLERTFKGFSEGQLSFAPTFKRIRGSNLGYRNKRKPSWTDRILH